MAIWSEIKESFKRGNIVTKLIYINLGIFLVANILYVILWLVNPNRLTPDEFNATFLTYFMVPADLTRLMFKPWTLITYMFLHFNFLHILFNLLWLYMFGRIFLMYLTEKQLLSTYILGGLTGALLYIVSYNVFPGLKSMVSGSEMLGASAGVMGVAMAISFYHPNYSVLIPLIGQVKLKYIALFFIFTDILQIASYNSGGHIAHLGGLIYALFFVSMYRKGKDSGGWLNNFFDWFVSFSKKRRRKMKVSYRKTAAPFMTDMEYNRQKIVEQAEIDRILDKIAKSGYDSLSKKEKETLFKMSDKN